VLVDVLTGNFGSLKKQSKHYGALVFFKSSNDLKNEYNKNSKKQLCGEISSEATLILKVGLHQESQKHRAFTIID
jgi:hypothetical protein